jgi:hypothetical protein
LIKSPPQVELEDATLKFSVDIIELINKYTNETINANTIATKRKELANIQNKLKLRPLFLSFSPP